MTYFRMGNPHYHWRGAVSLSCSGWEGVVPPRYGHQAEDGRPFVAHREPMRNERSNSNEASARSVSGTYLVDCILDPTHRGRQHGYRIKPHGQLVLVSLRPHSPSTPSLSTSWSRTTLQGGQASGKTNLQASFPLRCFQRLSLPHIATRRCHWRDNRYTRGASTPVLSY